MTWASSLLPLCSPGRPPLEAGHATPIPPRTVIAPGIVIRSARHLHHFGA